MDIAQSKLAPLESKRRLSESIVWTWQRRFYAARGAAAWSDGTVPHHISSSALLADAYARCALGFLRDCQATCLDPDQPLYILELGAGSGRLGYRFVRRLRELLRGARLLRLRVVYVMSDFRPDAIAQWRAHPWLAPLVDEGLLDFACFDVQQDTVLRLAVSGSVIEQLANPLIVVANYVFDSLPQDAFQTADGVLYELLASCRSKDKETDLDDPALLMRCELDYETQAASANYYGEPAFDDLLEQYRQRLPAVAFTFPVESMRCIARLEKLASAGMLMLSGDRGYHTDAELVAGRGTPQFAYHGSVSMLVDYQLLGNYVEQRGGLALHPARAQSAFGVSAFLLGAAAHDACETRLAFADMNDAFSPDDFSTLKDGIELVHEQFSLDELLAFLRLSRWDHLRFYHALSIFKAGLGGYDSAACQKIGEAVARTWENYFPIGESTDLAFEMGTLLLELGLHAEALAMLGHSEVLHGSEPGTTYNLALCHMALGDNVAALARVEETLALAPQMDQAKALRIALLETVEI